MMDSDPIVITGAATHSGRRRNPDLLTRRFDLVPERCVLEALHTHFPVGPWHVNPIHDGYGSIVYSAHCANGYKVVVKIGVFEDTHSPAEDFMYNSVLLREDSSLPLAQPALIDLCGKIIQFPYLVMHRLPGQSLLSLYERNAGPEPFSAVKQVARALALLHSPRLIVKGFGPLNTSTVQQIFENRRPELLEGMWVERDEYYGRGFRRNVCSNEVQSRFTQIEIGELLSIACNGAPIDLTRGCIHGDPSLRNFLFAEGTLTGIIDGTGRIGWIEEDVASCCVFIWQQSHRMTDEAPGVLVAAFYNEYVNAAGRQPDPKAFKALVLRKALSRICTGSKLGDLSGITSLVSLVREAIAVRGDDKCQPPWDGGQLSIKPDR